MNDLISQTTAGQPYPSIAVLMTCHNREPNTIRCLQSVAAQTDLAGQLRLFLVDDGSNDNTAQSVRTVMPEAEIITGDGNLYWNGGMRLAFSEALREDFDAYLWLNDDTQLDADALARLLSAYETVAAGYGPACIVVGSLKDPDTGCFTYGGWVGKRGRFGLNSWVKHPPADRALPCLTMNGNFVLIPRAVAQRIGNLDPVYRQGFGDLDYGLRATAAGCQVIIAPGYYGTCKLNDGNGMWWNREPPLTTRWQRLIGPKGFPCKAWGTFTRRHKGHLWFFAWLAPYALFWLNALRGK